VSQGSRGRPCRDARAVPARWPKPMTSSATRGSPTTAVPRARPLHHLLPVPAARDFVRPLSEEEVRELRARIQQINCGQLRRACQRGAQRGMRVLPHAARHHRPGSGQKDHRAPEDGGGGEAGRGTPRCQYHWPWSACAAERAFAGSRPRRAGRPPSTCSSATSRPRDRLPPPPRPPPRLLNGAAILSRDPQAWVAEALSFCRREDRRRSPEDRRKRLGQDPRPRTCRPE